MKTGVLIAAAVILIAGCKSEQAGHQVIQRGPAPTFQEVAAAYNNRVQPLSSLWAAVVLRLKYTDEEGQPHEDQVEGRLSFVSPRNVVLRLDKAGVTVRLGLEATPEQVLSEKPDVVIVATGSRPKEQPVGGADGPAIYNVWQVLNGEPALKALLMEVSFPNREQGLATVSGHHTPRSLAQDLAKYRAAADLPTLLYHIKPVFQSEVERECAALHGLNLEVCQIGDQFVL